MKQAMEWEAKKLDGEMDTNKEERVDGVLEELMGEGGQGGCRNSRKLQAIWGYIWNTVAKKQMWSLLL